MKSLILKNGDEVTVKIERMARGGAGVARHLGFVLFVPYTAPQEVVRVRVTDVKKSFADAEVIERLNPSPFQRVAPCVHAGECGGCPWQHIQYDEQLRQKEAMVQYALRKSVPPEKIEPLEPSPREFSYRNRIRLHWPENMIFPGYRKKASHDLVPISTCLIAEEPINEALKELRQNVASYGSQRGTFEFRLNSDKKVSMTWAESDDSQDFAFSQVNRYQNEKLLNWVKNQFISQNLKRFRFFDLYGGAGNFTFFLNQHFELTESWVVDLNEKAIQQAQATITTNKFSHIFATTTSIESFLASRNLTSKDGPVDPVVILLDPPRAGCSQEVLDAVLQSAQNSEHVTHVMYVSCDPMTFQRDLTHKLFQKFKLLTLKPFDMFPQTDHVEVIGFFDLGKPSKHALLKS